MEARAADGELMEGGPTAGRDGGRGEETGANGGDGFEAFLFEAGVVNERREFGADTSETSPALGVMFELGEDVKNDVVGEF